jgi:F420-dependent oxidoreductase-like protein
MRFAFKTSPENTTWADMLAVWRAADDIDVFESGWTFDHFYPIFSDSSGPCLEGWTTLTALAQATKRLRLGTLVTGIHYRHPAVLANMAAALDIISNGRLELGIGAGWNEEEHRGLGVPFPPTAERFQRLEETLQIVRQMFGDDDGPLHGRHYQLERTLCSPAPLRPVPIVVGGMGERKTLRLVAQYADACNLFGGADTGDVARRLEVLRRHCDDVGRDHGEIRQTILYQGSSLATGDVDAFIAEMGAYAELGIDQVMVMPSSDQPDEWLEKVGSQVVPRLAQL